MTEPADVFTLSARVRERMLRAEKALRDLLEGIEAGAPLAPLIEEGRRILALETQPASHELKPDRRERP